MGCVSSTLLNQDDEFSHIGGNGLGHHIVSLTSTTYGLLSLDPPPESNRSPTTPPTRFTLASLFPATPLSEPRSIPRSDPPEVINSWELMAGLDYPNDSFRFSPLPSKPFPYRDTNTNNKENSSPNLIIARNKPSDDAVSPSLKSSPPDGYEKLCPPRGENRVVVYTTTLRGVRKTFEDCNAVRAAIEGMGVFVCERDISMDKGFREELRELMKGKRSEELVPPRVFVRGKYVGGVEEVMRILEEGNLGKLLEGLPRLKAGHSCEGCGGVRFLPCYGCNGSCKVVVFAKDKVCEKQGMMVVARCPDCNENGLVLCPLCS